MRTANVALCVSALLLAAGALAGGCVANQASVPDVGDAASPLFDGGVLLEEASVDAHVAFDATLDAATDATPGATLSTTTVDFGLVNCGTGTASKTYSFTNSGPVPITYSANIATGSVFSVDGASSGTIAPGDNGQITVDVAGIPTTSVAGTPLTSTLTIATDVPGLSGVNVPLSVTPQGGSLTVGPALAGFGQVELATDGTPIPLAIANVGNAPVSVTFGAPTEADGGVDLEFGVVYPGSPAATTIAAGGSIDDAGATFAPTTAGTKAVTAAIQTTDPLCASAATGIAMSGVGTTAQITVGPDPLQFGTVTCGQTGTALQVTLRNSSPGAVGFTDVLGLGTASSPFTIDVTTGTVPAAGDAGAGTAVISVTPKKIVVPGSVTPGAYDDTLVVTPSALGVPPTTITLEESASGAIVAVTMANTAFGTVLNGSPSSLPFTVTNSGNVAAPVNLAVTGAGYTSQITSSGSTAAVDGGTVTGNVTFTATTNTTIGGSLTVSTTAALCSATPAAVTLSATGAIPVAVVPASAALSATCGDGATPTTSVTISNSGHASLAISAAASKLGHFSVSSSPAPIAASGNGSIVIMANPIATSAVTSIADTLTFKTNEIGGPTYDVPVTITVNGANLAVTMATTNFNTVVNTTDSLPFSVKNTGNTAAALTLGFTGTGYGAAFTSGATAGAGGGTAAGNATFTATADGPVSGSLTISTTDVICSAPLAPISLSAIGAVPIASVPAATIDVSAICGGGATTQGSVTVTNNGNAPLSLSGAVSVSGHFTVVSTSGPIAAGGGTGKITIAGKAIGQGTAGGTALSDTLKFTTNEVGDPTYSVPVSVAVNGANLSYVGASTITLTMCGGTTSYSVQNTGNLDGYVTGNTTYPVEGDTNGDTGVFEFFGSSGGGAFASSTLIAPGTPVADSVGPDDFCDLFESPCIVDGSQIFTSSGSSTSTTAVGICIPLPTLNLVLNMTSTSTTSTCQEICCS